MCHSLGIALTFTAYISLGLSQNSVWHPYCDTEAKSEISRVQICSTQRWVGISPDKNLLSCCVQAEHLCVQFLIGKTKCKQPEDMNAINAKQKAALKKVMDTECAPHKYGAKDCKELYSKTKPVSDSLCAQYLPCFQKHKELNGAKGGAVGDTSAKFSQHFSEDTKVKLPESQGEDKGGKGGDTGADTKGQGDTQKSGGNPVVMSCSLAVVLLAILPLFLYFN